MAQGVFGLFDTYTVRARLMPALIVVSPVFLAAAAWWPNHAADLAKWIAAVGLCGFAALLSHFARTRGKAVEKWLWNSWGGPPATRWLSHVSPELTKPVRERYHRKLEKLMQIQLPSAFQEAEDPGGAWQQYDACVNYLREQTRDHGRFPLVFAENVNYGFRRNLYGLKGWGLATCCAGFLAACGAAAWVAYSHSGSLAVQITSTALCLVLLLGWFAVHPQWVKATADAYARQLLAACEAL